MRSCWFGVENWCDRIILINKGTKVRLRKEKGLLYVNLVRARLGLRGRFKDSKKKPSLMAWASGKEWQPNKGVRPLPWEKLFKQGIQRHG